MISRNELLLVWSMQETFYFWVLLKDSLQKGKNRSLFFLLLKANTLGLSVNC